MRSEPDSPRRAFDCRRRQARRRRVRTAHSAMERSFRRTRWRRVAQTVSSPYLRDMNGTKNNDIDPATELVEEDEDQALPEQEPAIDLAAGAGTPCRWSRGHRASRQAGAVLARRLSHDRCQGRRALCRQGEEHPQTDHRLYPSHRLRFSHRAHDRRDRRARIRLDGDRDRSPPAGSQSDQTAAASLQRAAARRQIISLYPHHRRSLGAADSQAPRRAHP